MTTYDNNIDRVEVVAAGLKELLDEVVFLGGACAQFYVTNPKLRDYRPTKDVDCIVNISGIIEFNRFSEKLRKLGFEHDTSEGAPIIRWVFKGIIVDTMPDEGDNFGFRDIPWFREGRKHAIKQELPSGTKVNILPLSYYLATKLEASLYRGNHDYLADHDLEDIINIIDGNDSLKEILAAPLEVKSFIIKSFAALIMDDNFKRSISGHLGFEASATERANGVVEKMREII